MSNTSRKYIENALSMKISSNQARLQMTRTLMEVPVIAPALIDQYVKLFHCIDFFHLTYYDFQ